MIAVADTSPLNYLILLEQADLLEKIYSSIIIPERVRQELQSPDAPVAVRNWIANPPDWLAVASVPFPPKALLLNLHLGECEAILLAERLQSKVLMIDEAEGRAEAERRGIPIIGTLGVLFSAAERELIDFPDAVQQLTANNFRASPQILQSFDARYRELVASRSKEDDYEPDR